MTLPIISDKKKSTIEAIVFFFYLRPRVPQISRKAFIQPVYLPDYPRTKWSGMLSAIFKRMELCAHFPMYLRPVHTDKLIRTSRIIFE
jgi:hypothetical protein